MNGPIALVRSEDIGDYRNLGPIYEWSGGKAYLIIDRASFRGIQGAVLCYYNPPVHQVGNPGLDAYLEGLSRLSPQKDVSFLVLYGANDPVHAGGDLKESLDRLDATIEMKKHKEKEGASPGEIDRLYDWADNRLKKGIKLHAEIRKLARHMRIVAVCGGGTRFGGSAEIPLMADYLVGDSRSAMCFSEAMIGLIPGWGGVARSLIKAGRDNAEFMARTSKEIKAGDLRDIGIYNLVVDVPFPFPSRTRSDNPEADKAAYLQALQEHDLKTGRLLLPAGLDLAVSPREKIPAINDKERRTLAARQVLAEEVAKRVDPDNYSHIRGRLLKEVRDEVSKRGRPLAPQSIQALNDLFDGFDSKSFDELSFVEKEMKADAKLYRDRRFRAGLVATLEQKVPDYR